MAPAPAPTPQAAAIADLALAGPTAARKKRKGVRGSIKFAFVVTVLGALGAGGYVYGPDLLEQVRGESDGAVPTEQAEPEAPLDFPAQTVAPIEVRNATFVVADHGPDGTTRRFEITTDFETQASRVLIHRDELPTLEVMTFLDDAVVRRVDDDVWYQTPRGRFPLDDQLERIRWVRQLDELIPPTSRQHAAIERSTTSMLAGERMRRLLVSIDPALLGGPALSAGSFNSSAADALPPATAGAAIDSPPAVRAGADGAIPIDAALAAPPARNVDTPPATTPATISLEMWIDSRGVIRRLVTPESLGGESVTVTFVSPDAWLPDFPTVEQVEPLTASALVKLGL